MKKSLLGAFLLFTLTLCILLFIAGCGGSSKSPATPTPAPTAPAAPKIIQVSNGFGGHTLALKDNGTVWAWGNNQYGQLGDGATTSRSTPVQVPGLSGIIMVGAGTNFSVALKSDGTVWVWGWEGAGNGQLGDGDYYDDQTIPHQISGLSNIKTIALGSDHTLALTNGGQVYAWGMGDFGRLGNGSEDDQPSPVLIGSLSGITAIAAGSDHSLAVKDDNTVWAWGTNGVGQLGIGSTTPFKALIPVQVKSDATTNFTGAITVAAGNSFSLVIKNDNTVWAWGSTYSYYPAQVNTLSGDFTAVKIAAGDQHFIALKSDGTVWTWGSNSKGELGDGTTTLKSNPVHVPGLNGIIVVDGGTSTSFAITSGGTLHAWGWNYLGRLGNGLDTDTGTVTPVSINF
jgi:alpha-tubulin suppressor-like RCC1 family protein